MYDVKMEVEQGAYGYMEQKFYGRLTEILPENRIKEEEPMRLHTTFRVGRPGFLLCRNRRKR